jgi:hypothetical protein
VTVTGDPASASRLGSSLRLLATGLRTRHRALVAALEDGADRDGVGAPGHGVGRGRRGGAARIAVRRRGQDLAEALTTADEELVSAGTALQSHATELAEAVSAARDVVERASLAGLEVRDGQLVPRWGVAGVADPAARGELDARRAALQSELDTVENLQRRRRSRLVTTLRTAGTELAQAAEGLRR